MDGRKSPRSDVGIVREMDGGIDDRHGGEGKGNDTDLDMERRQIRIWRTYGPSVRTEGLGEALMLKLNDEAESLGGGGAYGYV